MDTGDALRPPGVPAEVVGRYRIGPAIGRGGQSTVYAARDLLLDRDVAIKLFRATADSPDQLRAQDKEAKLVASLNHFALTTLFDAGVDVPANGPPRVYLVMERVVGTDLRARLSHGALTPTQVGWLGFDLAEGLAYVHESGYLHGDIKPANVLLADREAATRPRAKLTDFGVSAIIGAAQDGEVTTGTAAYLSPEQVDGEDAGPASDVYALGLVLLEALTGRVEFPGDVRTSAFARLDRDPHVLDDLPEPLGDLLRRMTDRRPERRPSPTVVAADLQDFLIDGIVSARSRPAAHRDESARLEAVHRYNILDTPPDEAYDHVTRLASRLLGVPIALVTIIDADRVWFASKQGWDEPQVERNVSFCATTNEDVGPWSIPDAQADPRTALNPLVLGGPEVRSYAAAPLTTFDGHNLGALCVFDRQPRTFTQQDLADLADLATIVMRELELRLAARRALFHR